jgi:hypothetical protein
MFGWLVDHHPLAGSRTAGIRQEQQLSPLSHDFKLLPGAREY